MPLKLFEAKKNSPHVIGIAAGKGGVGKSSLTVLLAQALRDSGYRVGVLDADLYGPSIRVMLPEDKMPSQSGQNIIPALSKGIKLVSLALFKDQAKASVIRAPIANGLISQFLNQVEWGELDYLLIDFPPGTGDIQITLSQKANLTGAVVITTPQKVSVADVRKCMNMFEQVNIPIVGIIENMSYYQLPNTNEKVFLFGQGGGDLLRQEFGVPLLGKIPIHPILGRCLDEGVSLFDSQDPEAKNLQECLTNLSNEVKAQTDLIESSAKNCLGSFELVWKEML